MISNVDFQRIAELNLESVKVKLMHESGEGWTLEQANAVETEYRRFLYLMMKFPHEHTAPRVDVDTFWHYHILDTQKYAADCEHAFGYFLHHYPFVGISGEDPAAEHHASGERMRELYEQTFGISYDQDASAAYCSIDVPPARPARMAKDAYCSIHPPVAAYCSIHPPVSRNDSAYCSIHPPVSRAGSSVAYCSIPPLRQAINTAYCSIHPPLDKTRAAARTAYCSIDIPPAKPAAADPAPAFCSMAVARKPLARQAAATAYCSIDVPPARPAEALAMAA